MSLAQRESRVDLPEVSLQLLDPSAWRIWWPTVVSFESKTSSFLKHFHSCMLFGMQRANISGFQAASLLKSETSSQTTSQTRSSPKRWCRLIPPS